MPTLALLPAMLAGLAEAALEGARVLPCGPPCDGGDFVCCILKGVLTTVRVFFGHEPCPCF